MNRLPNEIISQIVGHVRDRDHPLTPLSLINHCWQPIVEVQIYRHLRLVYRLPTDISTSYDTYISRGVISPRAKCKSLPKPYLMADILTPTRLSYIRQLHVIFSKVGQFAPGGLRLHSWSFGETVEQFEKALKRLFNLLAATPHGQEPLLNLHFKVHGSFGDVFEPDFRSNISLHGLPELPMVSFFRCFRSDLDEVFSPHVLLLMASKMPRLRELDVQVCPRLVEVSSTHQRVELARSLVEVPLPTSIQNFTLRYHPRPGPDGFPTIENGEDILTRVLRQLSRREGLKYLTFYGRAEPSIFWPPHSAFETQQWPTLKGFILHLDRTQQLSSLRNGESLDVVGGANKRGKISKAILNAFCQALAKCSAHMPKVEYNSIEFNDIWGTSLACTVVSRDRCVELKGDPDLTLELDQETFCEWWKTASIHNLGSEMRIVERDQVVGH